MYGVKIYEGICKQFYLEFSKVYIIGLAFKKGRVSQQL